MKQRIRRWFWPALSGTLVVLLFVDHHAHADLHEQNVILKKLVEADEQLYEHAQAAGEVCDVTLIDTLQRLGLDEALMPLIPTLLWRRLTNGASVTAVRRQLGAKPGVKFLSDHYTIGP